MNFWIYKSVKLVHMLGMAVWIGGATIAPIGLRRSLSLGRGHAAEFVARLNTATMVIVPAGFTTFLSGAVLVADAGISNTPKRILLGAALTLLIFVVGGTLSRPVMGRLSDHFERGGDVGPAEPIARRFLWIVNIEMAIRLAVLGLMVFPIEL